MEWLLPGVRQHQAALLLEDPVHEFVAPDLIYCEAANAFRTAWRAGTLSAGDLDVVMEDLSSAEVATVDVRPLLSTIRPLLSELTAYDASYLALAQSSGRTLATFDRRLAKVARSYDVRVVVGA